jgi:hypothetical protein
VKHALHFFLKTDALARVRTPAARKRELPEELDRSGATFAAWAAKRKLGSPARHTTPPEILFFDVAPPRELLFTDGTK